jgi:hypothetical protein
VIRVLNGLDHLLRFDLRVDLVAALLVPVFHLGPICRKSRIYLAKLFYVQPGVTRQFFETVREDASGQGFVVKILGFRKLRNTCLQATFDCITNKVVGGPKPIIGEKDLCIAKSLFGEIL